MLSRIALFLKAGLGQPTQAQLEAGNYPKEHRQFQGLPVSVENPKGSVRSGRDRGGREWSITMKHDYGYVRGTLGVDGDHFDVYLGPNENADTAYVITTMAPPDFQRKDEQKAMLGFNSEADARAAFLQHYDNPKFLGTIAAIPLERFKRELATTRENPRLLKAILDAYFEGAGLERLGKALAAGERWITIHPRGRDEKGQPVLIKQQPDGSAKIIGGAGGRLNHLRLKGVRSEAEYKEEARSRVKAHREEQKRKVEEDKRLGMHASKMAARDAVREQLRDHEARFVQTVAKTLGWTESHLRFPEEQFANLSPSAQRKAAEQHARKLMQMAREAVDHQRQRLVQDAELRGEAGLGEVPITTARPEQLSVEDLAPAPSEAAGLGFVPHYEERAEQHGLTEAERAEEAASFKPEPDRPKAPKDTGTAIAEELKAIRDPGPKVDPRAVLEARAAVDLLKAEKALKAARAAAAEHNKKIDAAKQPVEPQAYVLEVASVAPDKEITAELEHDLRTLRTRAFLDEVGRTGNRDALGRHVGVGAYNAINAVSLAAGGAALLDRSVVDVLGIAGAAQVLARRLGTDLTREEMDQLRDAMGRFHVDHYMATSDQALREARDWHEMAQEIEIGEAATGADLVLAQELNAKRREFVGNAERVLGTALGEMEANAAVLVALEQPKKTTLQVSLGRTPIEQAITKVRALGLERGDYQLERIGPSTMLTVTGAGMDRLAAPVSREDLSRTRAALDIIEGRRDEDGWLPEGVTRRPEAAMTAPPGVAPRLAQPFPQNPADVGQAVEDYIGGRAADGDSPAEIMAGLLSEDVLRRSGDRAAVMAAIERICPLYDGEGRLVRAEAYSDQFEKLAGKYAEKYSGGRLPPIHRQKFEVDHVAVDALHQALAKHPDGVAAFKPVGELTPQDQAALRTVFAREYGRADPEAEQLRAELEKLDGAEPERDVQDMFGTGPNPAHADWRAKRDELAERVNKATMTWSKYLDVMGSPSNAYAAMQDVVRSNVLHEFALAHNRAKPDRSLKIGRTVIAHDLNHLDALDPVAREKRLAEHRALADSLRNRVQGRYAAGAVADKLEAARAHEEAFGQAQMGLFGAERDADAAAPEEKPVALGERYTLGHAAERQVAAMMPLVGHNFRPGQKTELWSPSMSGKYVARQRAVKLIEANRRVMLGMGVGSGKTGISLGAFTHLHAKGQAKRGLFVVPSIVQGQFHGAALTMLEPGKYRWHCNPGADRAERIAAYKDPDVHFNVVTHQAFRDDMLHLAAQREGMSPDAVAEKLDAMKPAERKAYMRALLDAEGIDHDYLAVDEGHNLLNRAGKENSRMANVLDGVAHATPTYVNMSADPVKNDASEAFDVLAKMDPERYSDRDAFMRRYGVDTAAAREGLRREMARHFYTSSIDPGVNAERKEIKVPLGEGERTHLEALDKAAAAARLARMKGGVDLDALRTLSPASFEEVDPAQHESVAAALNRSIGILHDQAVHRAISGSGKTETLAKLAAERKGRPGVVFCHHLDRVGEIATRLKADGHRVVTLTGADSSKDKDRKKREFQDGAHDVIVMSDAGAVGANLQRGKWLAQFDVPQTAMVHAQRNGRVHRIGQTENVELLDLVADHAAERRARKRLASKYELRGIMTSPLEGLDDTGLAGYLNRVRAGQLEAVAPVVAGRHDREPEPDPQAALF